MRQWRGGGVGGRGRGGGGGVMRSNPALNKSSTSVEFV